MKVTKLVFLLSLPLSLSFISSADAFIEKNTAVVRIMNKAAGKAHSIKIPVGKTVAHEKLNITVRTCKQTDPFMAEDFFMFAEVSEKAQGAIFSGWMSRNEPGDNPLQNPDYDMWLVTCE